MLIWSSCTSMLPQRSTDFACTNHSTLCLEYFVSSSLVSQQAKEDLALAGMNSEVDERIVDLFSPLEACRALRTISTFASATYNCGARAHQKNCYASSHNLVNCWIGSKQFFAPLWITHKPFSNIPNIFVLFSTVMTVLRQVYTVKSIIWGKRMIFIAFVNLKDSHIPKYLDQLSSYFSPQY